MIIVIPRLRNSNIGKRTRMGAVMATCKRHRQPHLHDVFQVKYYLPLIGNIPFIRLKTRYFQACSRGPATWRITKERAEQLVGRAAEQATARMVAAKDNAWLAQTMSPHGSPSFGVTPSGAWHDPLPAFSPAPSVVRPGPSGPTLTPTPAPHAALPPLPGLAAVPPPPPPPGSVLPPPPPPPPGGWAPPPA